MTDLTAKTIEQLETEILDRRNEIERQTRLADAPAEVARIATRYVEDGGDPADLAAALPNGAL